MRSLASKLLALVIGFALGFVVPGTLRADTPSDLERAKELFRQGNTLRKAGDCEGALEFFVRSRELVPSVPNILDAAYCLNVLGRYDEALEHYQTLLTDMKSELEPAELESIGAAIAKLRDKIGNLDVSVNVSGAELVVDGRPRGRLPSLTPIRVLPGRHRVQVMKDGYESFETEVRVSAGQTRALSASLAALRIAGRLRIDATALTGAKLIVDGAPVGVAPWEGVLAPGSHWIALRRGELGTAPTSVVVVKGQTVLLAPELQPLGPSLRIETDPVQAELVLDDVSVGAGRFSGALPLGEHHVVARAEGYFSADQRVQITSRGPRSIRIRLHVDPDHPRWGLRHGSFFVDASVGLAVGPSLGSGAEASCAGAARCNSNGAALGYMAGARGGYEFPNRLSLALMLGYVSLEEHLGRSFDASWGTTRGSFDLDDHVRVSGPLIGAGLGYRAELGVFELRAALFGGALLTNARDNIDAAGRAEGRTASAHVVNGGASVHGADLFAMPELAALLQFSGFHAGIGLDALFFLLNGASNEHGGTVIDEFNRCAEAPVYCAPIQNFSERERAYGRFFVLVPNVTAGFTF